jgi:hypothetical protein
MLNFVENLLENERGPMNDQDLTKTDYDPDRLLVLIEGLSHFLTNFLQNLASCQTSFKGPRVPKKAQFTHERVEYNVFLFDEPLKGSKSLKTFKISLTFHFDKL